MTGRDRADATRSSASVRAVFFLGYCFLELPSNMVLYRVGARVWIARIMITWGLVSAAMSFATGPTSFYVLRFLLGAAEAGFFPGIAFYLSTWFPSEYRTRIIAWFMVAIPISSVIGGPLSGLLLAMDGIAGACRLAVAVPRRRACRSVLVGVSVLWLLPDRPGGCGVAHRRGSPHRPRAAAGRAEAEGGAAPRRRRSRMCGCGCWRACSSGFSSARTASGSSCRRY